MDVASLADLLHETAERHDSYEKVVHGRPAGRRRPG
jgi:hypothetical protein